MKPIAFATALSCGSSFSVFGRHRLHGLKPKASASAIVFWKLIFARRANLAGQVGLQ
jgi:hypothetical protein